ncbi:MAG: hypothetical protein AVDCRST_MAG30-2331, partial [uncultured Solirubrobacteraceae bacterium]
DSERAGPHHLRHSGRGPGPPRDRDQPGSLDQHVAPVEPGDRRGGPREGQGEHQQRRQLV